MSGRPNKEQVSRVILIGRTLSGLVDEADKIRESIKKLEKRKQEVDYAYRKLNEERDKLLTSMDCHPSQTGNFGSEVRQEMFLNLVTSLNPIGIAEEPK